jgi:hypothetical protein
LKQLRRLWLDGNLFQSVPSLALQHLSNLEALYVYSLPRFNQTLSSLTDLFQSPGSQPYHWNKGGRICKLDPAHNIVRKVIWKTALQLPSLSRFLHDNNITRIHPMGLRGLRNLQHL